MLFRPRNIDVSTDVEFPWIFHEALADFDDLYTSLLTVNVEPFKNRVFKSNDVSPRRHQSRQREAATRPGNEEGKKDEVALKRSESERSENGGEIVLFSGSRRRSRWKAKRRKGATLGWNLLLLRRLNLSPQFHGHRVPRMPLKGRLLFFDPLRVASPRSASLLNGRR